MDSKQIDVMVADASHEVYVDKILDMHIPGWHDKGSFSRCRASVRYRRVRQSKSVYTRTSTTAYRYIVLQMCIRDSIYIEKVRFKHLGSAHTEAKFVYNHLNGRSWPCEEDVILSLIHI